jgi:hypothetical protein
MTRLRRALGPLTAAWIVCQVATLASSPVALWLMSADLAECTCTTGDHASCPMHHKQEPGSKICLLRSAADPGTMVLASIFSGAGLLPTPAVMVASSGNQPAAMIALTTRPSRQTPPDPPPPRS